MKYLKFFTIAVLLAALLGCASGSRMKKSSAENPDPLDSKAYQHYFDGALFDFQDDYEKALIEYYQALLYDSSSAQIRKAIARNLMRLQYYESAAEYLKKVVGMDPKDKEALNYLAESYYNLQNYSAAIEYYNRLLKLDPYNTTVQNNLIFLYSQLKMDQKLLDFYRMMMRYYPDDSKFALQYALSNLKQKNVNEARQVLEKIIDQDSSQTDALVVLANLYEVKKDTANAIRIYRKILIQDPGNEEVIARLYRLFRAGQQWDEMINLFSNLLSRNPENPQLRIMLAEGYFFRENHEQARQILQPVLDDDAYRAAALELLGRIAFEEENLEEAEKYFSALTEENPDNRFGWLFLTVVNNQQNNYEKSIRILERALTIHSEDPDLLSMYGSVLSQVGRDSEALKPLQKAIEIDSSDVSALSSLAAIYDKMKMYQKSDSIYAVAMAKAPENALLLNNYSYSLAQRGLELDKAMELVSRALEIEPDNGAYLDTKGWIFYQMGQYEKALEYIQKALDSREESAEVLEHLGDVYFKLGNSEQAEKHWKQALEKDPSNSELQQKIQTL